MHSIHNTKWELRQIKKERRVHVQPDYLSRWYYKSSNIAVAYSCLLLYLFIDIENFYNYIYDFLFINLQIIPQVKPQIKYFITDLSKMEKEKLCVFVGHNRKTSNYKKKTEFIPGKRCDRKHNNTDDRKLFPYTFYAEFNCLQFLHGRESCPKIG